MTYEQAFVTTIYDGWRVYQDQIVKAIAPLSDEQLTLRAAPGLRTVHDIATHVIGARARWFNALVDGANDAFKTLGQWDRRDAPARSAAELVAGLETTWSGMQQAINAWTAEQWGDTWPGEDDSEPETITRQWVIWHLIEHDLHHGGEISLTLGAHGILALEL